MSSKVIIADGSRINADGVGIGKGGQLEVNAIDYARVGGTISARGGRSELPTNYARKIINLGEDDGGLVQIIPRGALDLTATIDLSAREGFGRAGTIELVPNSIEIISGDCVVSAGSGCGLLSVPIRLWGTRRLTLPTATPCGSRQRFSMGF